MKKNKDEERTSRRIRLFSSHPNPTHPLTGTLTLHQDTVLGQPICSKGIQLAPPLDVRQTKWLG